MWTGKKLPRHYHPHQFLLKSFQISGRKNCMETIFALENEIFCRKNRPVPTVHAAGHDWKLERASTLSSSPGVFRQTERVLFSSERAFVIPHFPDSRRSMSIIIATR